MATTIILIVLGLMVIAMVTSMFEFGVAPLLACVVLALTGVVTFQEAFAGFANKYVIVTAAFLVISVLFGRTSLIARIQTGMLNLQKGKSGLMLFLAMILFVLVIAAFMQPGPAALLLIVLVTALPATSQIAPSQMMLPLGSLANLGQGKLPFGTLLILVVLANGFLEKAAYTAQVSITNYMLMGILPLIVAVVFALVAYRLLPAHPISASAQDKSAVEDTTLLPKKHEWIVYAVFAISTLVMFFSTQLGDYLFIIPVAGVAVLLLTGVITFKNVRGMVNHQLIFMLAGIFALADIMASKGISAMLGSSIQSMLGGTTNGWVIMAVFAFATVLLANFTGSNFGTMFIIAPIAISTAMAAGVDPRATLLAVMASATASVIMPMDTAMGIIIARGEYKLGTTFKYTIPLTILYIVAVILSAGLVYPM